MNSKFLNDYWPLIVAVKEGKTVQESDLTLPNVWHDLTYADEFTRQPHCYRTKPEPELVPMEDADFPPVFWVTNVSGSGCFLVTETGHCGVVAGNYGLTFMALLAEGWKYSTDRKTWKPCSKEKKTVADIIKGKSDACIAHAHEKGIPHDTLNPH